MWGRLGMGSGGGQGFQSGEGSTGGGGTVHEAKKRTAYYTRKRALYACGTWRYGKTVRITYIFFVQYCPPHVSAPYPAYPVPSPPPAFSTLLHRLATSSQTRQASKHSAQDSEQKKTKNTHTHTNNKSCKQAIKTTLQEQNHNKSCEHKHQPKTCKAGKKRLANKQTNKQTSKPTNKQTNKQANKQNRIANKI